MRGSGGRRLRTTRLPILLVFLVLAVLFIGSFLPRDHLASSPLLALERTSRIGRQQLRHLRPSERPTLSERSTYASASVQSRTSVDCRASIRHHNAARSERSASVHLRT